MARFPCQPRYSFAPEVVECCRGDSDGGGGNSRGWVSAKAAGGKAYIYISHTLSAQPGTAVAVGPGIQGTNNYTQ